MRPVDCPTCRGDGYDATRSGGIDACGRCARLAELRWQARRAAGTASAKTPSAPPPAPPPVLERPHVMA